MLETKKIIFPVCSARPDSLARIYNIKNPAELVEITK